MENSKGQFNTEFFVVLILFVSFSTYFSLQLLKVQPTYVGEVKRAIIRAESYKISEMLINTLGHPINWTAGDVEQIGFLDQNYNKTNLVSEEKITNFDTLCAGGANYMDVKDVFDTDYNFSILIVDRTGPMDTVDCSASEIGRDVASIRRFVAFDSGNYGEIIVQVW